MDDTPQPMHSSNDDPTPMGLAALQLKAGSQMSVTDQVHRLLRQAIIAVRLVPGTMISENALCKQLSISRSPVRAAIQRLAEEGLVDVSPQRGSYVAPMHMHQLRDGHFVRRSLELALLRETAPHWTAENTARLRAIIAEQERAIAAGDSDLLISLDKKFHRSLAEVAGRAGVWTTIETAFTALRRFYHFWATADRLVDVIAEHNAIIDALERRDTEAAEAALATHLDMVFVILDRMTDEQRKELPF